MTEAHVFESDDQPEAGEYTDVTDGEPTTDDDAETSADTADEDQ